MSLPTPRIGVFGGAFDPPHLAHVALVSAALNQLNLTALHVLPTGQAWHKTRALSPAADRLAMAQLAFGSCAGVVVDDRELRRIGPTYTVETLAELQAQYPGAQLVLLIGWDQAKALPRWHRIGDILRAAIISVAFRADSAQLGAESGLDGALPELSGARWEPLQWPLMPHSATEIRACVANGLPIDHLVPAAVARYIDQHHLYLPA